MDMTVAVVVVVVVVVLVLVVVLVVIFVVVVVVVAVVVAVVVVSCVLFMDLSAAVQGGRLVMAAQQRLNTAHTPRRTRMYRV